MRRMSERPRRRNGAEKRGRITYKGERELIGGRVFPHITDLVDETREKLGGMSKNDFVAAAILVALDHPDEVLAADAKLQSMLPNRRTNMEGDDQLQFVEAPPEEDLAQSA